MQRKLNQKQVQWLRENLKVGMVIQQTDSLVSKIISVSDSGYCKIEQTWIYRANEDNYNMGLISKDDYVSGKDIVKTRIAAVGCSSVEWKQYFPKLSEIKSK